MMLVRQLLEFFISAGSQFIKPFRPVRNIFAYDAERRITGSEVAVNSVLVKAIVLPITNPMARTLPTDRLQRREPRFTEIIYNSCQRPPQP